jgi:hypothetical protein
MNFALDHIIVSILILFVCGIATLSYFLYRDIVNINKRIDEMDERLTIKEEAYNDIKQENNINIFPSDSESESDKEPDD